MGRQSECDKEIFGKDRSYGQGKANQAGTDEPAHLWIADQCKVDQYRIEVENIN